MNICTLSTYRLANFAKNWQTDFSSACLSFLPTLTPAQQKGRFQSRPILGTPRIVAVFTPWAYRLFCKFEITL